MLTLPLPCCFGAEDVLLSSSSCSKEVKDFFELHMMHFVLRLFVGQWGVELDAEFERSKYV
jgi:hypothetical protein